MTAEQDGSLHEPCAALRPQTRDRHRALLSLKEELEAVDWYDQRIDAAQDEELRAILVHNRDEEKEHASMLLEWLRRRDAHLDHQLRTHLFQEGPIAGNAGGNGKGDESLGIGSLRERDG